MQVKYILKSLVLMVPEIRKLYDERNYYKRELGKRIEIGSGGSLPQQAPMEPDEEKVDATDLHLGCGRVHIKGWCNVDIYPGPSADIVDDISVLRKFQNDSAKRIYACHCLEHFSHEEIPIILRRWLQVLRPAGELRISVPDLDKVVRLYLKHWEHFQTPGNSPWIGLIYGGQGDPFDFHKTGFNFAWMKFLLETAGFVGVEEYPVRPHFLGIRDGSLAEGLAGEAISLNVVAFKR